MKTKQIITAIFSALISVSMVCSPIVGKPAFAAEEVAESDITGEAIEKDTKEGMLGGSNTKDSEDVNNEEIPVESVVIECGSGTHTISYIHEENIPVSFEFELDFAYDFRTCDTVDGFTTNLAECGIIPFESGTGAIKVIDDSTGEILKIFNITVEPATLEYTVCKSSYSMTNISNIPGGGVLQFISKDGIEVKFRDSVEDNYLSWDLADHPFDDLSDSIQGFLNYFSVKGIMSGEYSIPYFFNSVDKPFMIVQYHVAEHNYLESSVLKEATCKEDGLVEKKCSNCYQVITEVIPTAGHTWNEEYTVDKEATCTEEGSESIHCSVCDAIDETTVGVIPKKNHTYGEWIVTKEAACTEDGIRKRVCVDCGAGVTEAIPAAGHIWNEECTVDKEATCTEEGSESIHCSVCDAIDETTVGVIPKKDHTYGEWIVTKEVACTEDGIREKACVDCGDKVTELIPTAGHTWNEEYTIDKQPTYTEEGSKSIHCSLCNALKEGSEVVISRLPKPISLLTISEIVTKTYTGKALTQTVVINDSGKTLVSGRDYNESYKNNINAGIATVTISGKGNYTGTKKVTFKINKADQSIKAKSSSDSVAVGKTVTISITGNKGSKSYKSSNTAIATVTADGKVTAKKVGTVKITATSAATTNYNAESKTVTIKVVPAATSSITVDNQVTGIKLTWKKVAGANAYFIYRGNTQIAAIKNGSTVTYTDKKANTNGTKYVYKIIASASVTGRSTLSKSVTTYWVARPAISSLINIASKKMTVKWGKNTKCTGYQIHYCTDKTFKSGNKVVNISSASTVSKVIGSLTKGKTYYVRLRTYKTVGSTKYFSAWSPVKSVKISK